MAFPYEKLIADVDEKHQIPTHLVQMFETLQTKVIEDIKQSMIINIKDDYDYKLFDRYVNITLQHAEIKRLQSTSKNPMNYDAFFKFNKGEKVVIFASYANCFEPNRILLITNYARILSIYITGYITKRNVAYVHEFHYWIPVSYLKYLSIITRDANQIQTRSLVALIKLMKTTILQNVPNKLKTAMEHKQALEDLQTQLTLDKIKLDALNAQLTLDKQKFILEKQKYDEEYEKFNNDAKGMLDLAKERQTIFDAQHKLKKDKEDFQTYIKHLQLEKQRLELEFIKYNECIDKLQSDTFTL